MTDSVQPQPKMTYRRLFAFLALFHFFFYTLVLQKSEPWVIGADMLIIGYWAIGGAALVDLAGMVYGGKKNVHDKS